MQSARDVEPTTASLSLPPLRSIDPLQRFTAHPSQDAGLSKGLPPPGLPPISQYHHPQLPGISQYHITSSNPRLGHGTATGHPTVQVDCLPHPTSLPIAPSGSHRLLSGGRHKKEVKRRTKTGCLTCRRRRIKVSHLLLRLKRGAKDGCGFARKKIDRGTNLGTPTDRDPACAGLSPQRTLKCFWASLLHIISTDSLLCLR